MRRLFRVSIVTALILFIFVPIFAAPSMEWGRMVGGANAAEAANAPAHYRKDDGFATDFTVILKVTGDSIKLIDTFIATIAVDSSFEIPTGEEKTKKVKNLYPGDSEYLYWAITPYTFGAGAGVEQNFPNALQMDATYYIEGAPYTLSSIQRDIYVVQSWNTGQFVVTNNIVGDLLLGGYVEIIQTVEITGGSPENLSWGNFLDRYDTVKLADIKSDFPNHQDPQTYYPYGAVNGKYHITYKFYISPNSTSDTVSLNNYFLGDTGQWRTQDSEFLGTGIPSWQIYPQGFEGKITECRSGIGIPNVSITVYKMDNSVYDTRSHTISNGVYSFGVADTGTYKLYFNDPSSTNYDPSYSSYLDDNGGAGYYISINTILTVNDCLYHYNGGAVYFDNSLYRDGDLITVTVEDLDLNTDPSISETVDVTLTSLSGDMETLILTEMGTDSGIYDGTISASIPFGSTENGVLEGADNDTLTVKYHDNKNYNGVEEDYFDYATLKATTTSIFQFTDNNYNNVDGYAIGNTVYLEIQDGDENENNALSETVAALLYDSSHNDTEHYILTESTPASGIFIGSISLVPLPSTSENGILEINPGNLLIGLYTDDDDSTDTSTDSVRIVAATNSSGYFTDGTDQAYKYIVGEDNINVLINDLDQNLNFSNQEGINVTIKNSIDTEIMTLLETGNNTGIFVNTQPFTLSSSPGASSDGILNNTSNDTLTFFYTDKYNIGDTTTNNISTLFPASASIKFLDELGGEATFYYIGKNCIVECNDIDENKDPNTKENVTIILNDLNYTDTETITLTETDLDNGIFKNIGIPISDGSPTPENGTIDVSNPDTILARYIDKTDPTDTETISILTYKDAHFSTLYFCDSSGNLKTGIIIGNDIYLKLNDPDLNNDPGKIETATVTIYNDTYTDTENITLYETSSNSGEFLSNLINNTLSSTTPYDNTITCNDKGYIFARYEDPGDPSDISISSIYTVKKTNGIITLYDIDDNEKYVFLAGNPIRIEVSDYDNNLNPNGADTVTVIVTNDNVGDTETVILTETEKSSGIFSNSLPTDVGPLFTENGSITGFNDQQGNVHYIDKYDSNESCERNFLFKENSNSTLSLTNFNGYITKNSYNIGEKVYMRCIDEDNNRDLNNIDYVEVTLHTENANDTEIVSVPETALSSGEFFYDTGIYISKGAAILSDGTIQSAGSDTLVATYKDKYNSSDISIFYAFITEATNEIKTLHFHQDLSADTFIVSNTQTEPISTKTWIQAPAFRKDFNISGLLTGTFYIDGTATGTMTVEKILAGGSIQTVAISDDFSVTTASTGYVISAFPAITNIIEGEKLKITLNLTSNCNVSYDSQASDSRLDIPTITYINVDSAGGFYKPYSDDPGNTTTAINFYKGQTIYVRSMMSDPFGSQDILNSTGAEIIIPAPYSINDTMTMVSDTGYESKLFEYSFIGDNTGSYDVNVTGVESNGVTDNEIFQIVISTSPSDIQFIDNSKNSVDNYTIGDTVDITLDDLDKNLHFGDVDTVAVTLRNTVNNDSETIILSEEISGIFIGGIISTENAIATLDNNILEASDKDTITVTYNDPFDANDSSSDTAVMILRTDAALWVEDENKAVQSAYKLDQNFYVHIRDIDENMNKGSKDTVLATLHSILKNDTEIVPLTETEIDTGTFYSDLLKFSGNASALNDGIFSVSSPDTITVTYIDSNDSSDTDIKIVTISPATLGILSFDNTIYSEGDTITISLYDPDLNIDITTTEDNFVYIMGQTGDTEKVDVYENGIDSDTFIGKIKVYEDQTPSIYTVYDSTFLASGDAYGDTITAIYYDNSSPAGGTTAVDETSNFDGTSKYLITKEQKDSVLPPTGTEIYTISYRNYSTTNGNNVDILDPLSTDLSFVSATDGGTFAGNTVTYSIGALSPSEDYNTRGLTVTLSAALSEGDTVTNYALIDDTIIRETSNIVICIAGYFPDLRFSEITDMPDPVNAGETITYQITVENAGNTAAKNLLLDSRLPDNTIYVSGGSYAPDTVTFILASLDVSDTYTFSYIVSVSTPIANNTTIYLDNKLSADNNETIYSDTTETTVISCSNLFITKSVDKLFQDIGGLVTYTLDISNIGTDTAANVVLEDQLPFNTIFVSADGGGGLSGTTVLWNFANIAAGSSSSVHFTVTVSAGANYGDTIWNVARGKQNSDTVYAYSNNVSFEVKKYPDLDIEKIAALSDIYAGNTIQYTIVIGNTGSDTAANVTISDNIPSLFSYVSANPAGTLAGNTVSWDFTTLGIDNSETVTLILLSDSSIPNTTLITNCANVDAGYGDSDNSCCDITVHNSATFVISLSGPIDINCGETFTYSIAYRNSGGTGLTNTTIYNTIPYPLTYISGGDGFDGTGVTFNTGDLPAFSAFNTVSFIVKMADAFTDGYVIEDKALGYSVEGGYIASNPFYTTIHSNPQMIASKSVNYAAATPGDTLIYTITVENTGTDSGFSVVSSDTLDPMLIYISGADIPGPPVGINFGTVLPGEIKTRSFIVQINVVAPLGMTISNDASISGSNFTSFDTNSVNTLVGYFSDPAIIGFNSTASFLNIGDTSVLSVVVENAGDTPSTSFALNIEIPNSLSVINAGGGTLVGNILSFTEASFNVGDQNTETFTIQYNNPTTHFVDTELIKAYTKTAETEKRTENNTKYISIILHNDTVLIEVVNGNRMIFPETLYNAGDPESFNLSGHIISPNNDGFKDYITVIYRGISIDFDGKDNTGTVLPDGKYKMRLRINYAYGDTKIYDEEFYIKNNPEHLIENIKIYPNPAKNGKMVIAYTPNYQCDVTVDIYSVSGRKVTTLCNEDYLSESINWNCKNKDAKDVASGIYFIVIKAESSGKREIYKPLKSAIIK